MTARVCHIITKLELGGAQQNTLYTVAHLDRRRFEPVLIAGSEGLLVEESRRIGLRSHYLPDLDRSLAPHKDLPALIGLARLLRAERPDIVHTHSSKAGILGRWAALLAGVPHIVHSIHGYGFHDGQPAVLRSLLVALERVTARCATSAFVAVSDANLRAGVEMGLFEEDRVALIRSGIELSAFHPSESRTGAFTNNGHPVTIGMVACLKPQKAPVDFVRAAALVVAASGGAGRVRFVLAGDGEQRPEVERAIREHKLEGVFELLGWRRDIPDLLRSFDILVHTSRWEGLPRVFPEAMATGLPIVATRVDGAPEAIEDGVTGYLVRAGDIEGLADRTLRLIADPELRRRMGAAALRRTAPWDIDEMVRRQERLYEALLSGRARQGVARVSQREA